VLKAAILRGQVNKITEQIYCDASSYGTGHMAEQFK